MLKALEKGLEGAVPGVARRPEGEPPEPAGARGQAEPAAGLPARKQGLVGALQSCLRRSRVCLGRKASKEEVVEGQA